jgi:serine/threonine-protein kinase HipA
MDGTIQVYVDLNGEPVLAGRLWARSRHQRQSASFEYESSWLARKDSFALDPLQLPLGTGSYHTPLNFPIFNVMADGAPDRWGRTLMQRQQKRRLEAGRRTLLEIDYLLMVDDEARQGALRYKYQDQTEFLSSVEKKRIPPLVFLPRLLNASTNFLKDNENDEDLRLLLAPGSSLGGARPKASVRDTNGALLIAKFPRPDDDFLVCDWENLALDLAQRAGIRISRFRLFEIDQSRILLLNRFDRDGANRVPFCSALTLLGTQDNQEHSYLEIADAIRRFGSRVDSDLEELWRRLVFNIMIANTDDHLCNFGFLWDGIGWRLSPAYDLNPTPMEVKSRIMSLAIDEENHSGDLDLALSVAQYFGLSLKTARQILDELEDVISKWAKLAKSLGISRREVSRMESAFLSVAN